MKQLTWCLIGIIFAVLFGGLSAFAWVQAFSLLAHPPSPSWLEHARYLTIIWSVYFATALLALFLLLRRVRRIFQDKEALNHAIEPRVPLLTGTIIAAAATLLLPAITGYGTILFQWVVLGAWGLVAKVTSSAFADHHSAATWTVAFCLNVGAFFLPASILRLSLARLWPRLYAVTMIGWILLYLASLLFLFPATDGP